MPFAKDSTSVERRYLTRENGARQIEDGKIRTFWGDGSLPVLYGTGQLIRGN